MTKRLQKLIGTGLSCAFGLSAMAADATGPTANSDELQEITVTGLRASMEKSLELKMNSAVVQDSINATELGRFPDADVADSLQHLPGITISRTTGGEGQKVTVRGFGPSYNIVTLNGRILATDDDARDLAFDVLPSEVISGADVLKSPQASALEGSIGGTVNLRTASAFDTPGLHAGVHAEGNWNDMSYLWGQKYSAFLSDTFADDKLGFLVGLVHSDNKQRTDALNNNNQYVYGPCAYPFTYDCSTPAAGSTPITAAPYAIAFGSIYDEKKRDAISASLDFRPTSDIKLTLDGLYTRLRDPQNGYNQSYYFPYAEDANGPLWSNPTIDSGGLITGLTSRGFQPEAVNSTLDRNVDTQLYGLNGSWNVNSRLTLGFDVYHSLANRPEGGSDIYATAGLVSPGPSAIDTLVFNDTAHGFPNINVGVPASQLGLSACPGNTASSTIAGNCSYTALLNGGYLNNNNLWSTHYVSMNGYSVRDQIDSGELHGNFKVDLGPLNQIDFGFVNSHRSKKRVDEDNGWNNGSAMYGALYNTAGCPIQCSPYSFGSQGFNALSFLTPANFMKGAGGSFPYVLPALNVPQLLAYLQSLDGKPNPYGGVFDYAASLPTANPYNSYKVTEKTYSGYLQTDWSGDRWSGNLGVRVVHTSTTAEYAQAVPTDVWTPDATASTITYFVDYNLGQQTKSNASYTIALPSLNFSFWAIPKELQLRASIAETMSRPNLNQLAPNSTNGAVGGRSEIYYSGTVGLKPIKVWQGDLSAEWYYHPRAAVTLAYFEKHVRDDIYSGVTTGVDLGTKLYVGGPPGSADVTSTRDFIWTIYAPANGLKETYRGVELTWQHLLDNGLGAHVQVTHTSSPGDAVNTAPPTTASIGALYEKGPISADVNWDYTSRYKSVCSVCTEVTGWPVYNDSFQWLTASVHYKFFEGFDVYVEGRNLTNAIQHSYLNNNPYLIWANGASTGQSASGVGAGYTAFGRTFVAGLAYRF